MSINTQKQGLKSTFSTKNNEFNGLSTAALLAKESVPALHRELANSYVLIKKIYKFPVVKYVVSEQDKKILKKYSFKPLADSDIETINNELKIMREMSASAKEKTRTDADILITIRTKELKYIIASKHSQYSNELNNGYLALERYFEEISKYYS